MPYFYILCRPGACFKLNSELLQYDMMRNLPWQVKRLVVVQLVQVVSGPPNFEIGIIQQHFWLARHIFYLEQ